MIDNEGLPTPIFYWDDRGFWAGSLTPLAPEEIADEKIHSLIQVVTRTVSHAIRNENLLVAGQYACFTAVAKKDEEERAGVIIIRWDEDFTLPVGGKSNLFGLLTVIKVPLGDYEATLAISGEESGVSTLKIDCFGTPTESETLLMTPEMSQLELMPSSDQVYEDKPAD